MKVKDIIKVLPEGSHYIFRDGRPVVKLVLPILAEYQYKEFEAQTLKKAAIMALQYWVDNQDSYKNSAEWWMKRGGRDPKTSLPPQGSCEWWTIMAQFRDK